MSVVSHNAWRLKFPEITDWQDRLFTGSSNKYLVISCDAHINEPLDVFSDRIDATYLDRLPRMEVDSDGTQWLVSEATTAPQLVRIPPERDDLLMTPEEYESFEVMAPYTERMEQEDLLRHSAGRDLTQRRQHAESQGVDYEIVFANKGLLAFATPDSAFSTAMCRAWNRWAKDLFANTPQFLPMAMIAPGDVDAAIAEVQWAALNGFKGLLFPNRPIYHRKDQARNKLEYNNKSFEPLWASVAETELPITLHVSTGEDPRAVGGHGGAITNFVCHSMTTTLEPLVQLITSGVFERNPKLKVATIESGIGWVPWLLQQMDYAYRAHHMWVRPVIPNLPSDYYKSNCFSAFIEEPEGLVNAIEAGLEDNILWSNDYPHHEGSFPHTQASIIRQFSPLHETQRVKVLGINAARLFGIKNK